MLTLFSLYGGFRGADEVVKPPVIGELVTVTGTVQALYQKGRFALANLVINQVQTATQLIYTQVNTAWTPGRKDLTESHISVGSTVHLTGIFIGSGSQKKSHESQFLRMLSPEYTFQGRLLNIVTSDATITDYLRGKIHQATVSNCLLGQKQDVPLLESVIFGGNTVSTTLHQIFLQSGVLHILAASGANILLVERFIGPVLRVMFLCIPLGSWAARILLVVFIWGFSLLCGSGASIQRAALMSTYRIIGEATGRQVSSLSGLLFAGLCLATISPSVLWSISSILSFTATFAIDRAIHTVHPRHSHRPEQKQLRFFLKQQIQNILHLVQTTIWVELYSAPLVILLFNQWTPYSIVSNVFIEPILMILLPVSLTWLILCMVNSYLSFLHFVTVPVSNFAFFMLHLLQAGLRMISSWPYSLIQLTAPSPIWFVAYYILLIGVPIVWKKFRDSTTKYQTARASDVDLK